MVQTTLCRCTGISKPSSGHWTWLGGSFSTVGDYPAQKGQSGGWPGSRGFFAWANVGDTFYLFGGGNDIGSI